jgi:repressor LexA
MSASNKLTTRQQQVLDLIKSFIRRSGAPPTRAEIAAELGFKSPNAAEEHLHTLARKGAIELLSGTSRGIRLLAPAQQKAPRSALSRQLALPTHDFAQLSLPLVGRVAAGSPILAQEHIEQAYLVQADLFSTPPDYLLRVRGMSMRDAGIWDGDLLAVKKTQVAQNGQIVVARLDHEVTVKRLRRTAQKTTTQAPRNDGEYFQDLRNDEADVQTQSWWQSERIELLPENPDFQIIEVTPEHSDFAIEGLAVGLIRNQNWM